MSQVKNISIYQPHHFIVMTDANVMIQYFDSKHKYYGAVKTALRHSIKSGVEFYYPDFCLREFREYFRKLFIRNYLVGYIKNHSLGPEVDRQINSIRNHRYISDQSFKDIREQLEISFPGNGYRLWFNLCEKALVGKIKDLENLILGANFLILKPDNLKIFKNNKPDLTKEMIYTNKFGLGTIDSALISWFDCSEGVDSLITNDHDLLLAQKNGALPSRYFLTTIITY